MHIFKKTTTRHGNQMVFVDRNNDGLLGLITHTMKWSFGPKLLVQKSGEPSQRYFETRIFEDAKTDHKSECQLVAKNYS